MIAAAVLSAAGVAALGSAHADGTPGKAADASATAGSAAATANESARPVVDAAEPPAPLVYAARAGDSAAALALLAAHPKVNVNQHTADGTTALHWAVYRDDVPLIERLIAAGADANAKNDYGSTPLSEAATVGDARVIRDLLKAGANVESANADGQSALMILARTSNIAAARLLIEHGANVNARERWREQTPLMWAAAENQPAMVRLLVEHGAQVDARSHVNHWERQVTVEPRRQARPSGGFTPLLYAARVGCTDCVRILVRAGADKNLPDPDGVTPMLEAVLNLNFDVAAYLVQAGADVDRWDIWGRSPLYEAVDVDTLPVGGRADRPSLDRTSSLELIRMLLAAGANPNLQLKLFPPYRSLRDDRGADAMLTIGTTPLLRAAKAGDMPAMRLLLAHGANPDLPNESGITPLMAAAGNGSSRIDTRGRYKTEAQAVEAVELLLASGAQINGRDRVGQTALFGAATWGWSDVVRALASHHADLFVKDTRGRTAADIAQGSASSSGRSFSEPHPQTAALLRALMAAAGAPAAASIPTSARVDAPVAEAGAAR
ncbi:MAG TPA: ankyrin repeat domain-containing protein [Steroidobacteraceae bacterium]|nr:ankyrin repeat domain-containing protein [Steroidobacteraceae bacterium]